MMKTGSKIGSKTVNVRDKAYWHHIFALKDWTHTNMSQADFLQNDATGKDMIGTRSECQLFGKYHEILPNSNKS